MLGGERKTLIIIAQVGVKIEIGIHGVASMRHRSLSVYDKKVWWESQC